MVHLTTQNSVHLARKAAVIALILSSTALTPLRAKAAELPTGANVAAGQVSIATGGSTMLIDQGSQNAIINWDSFSVGNGGMVTFQNGSGATLNRVTGTGLSSIDGTLKATGSLFLVNQNGIVIGKDGVVQTGGKFVASTLDIQDSDFLDGGDMTFAGSSAASVTNLGKVGSLGGDIAFIARHIVNEGDVSAPNGTVGLAAGREILMRDASLDDGMFLVKVGDTDSSITEAGVITAATVELRTHGGNIYALAGNKGGAINATGVSTSGGRIFLTAGGGKVHVAKKVRATRQVSGKRTGGDIFINADIVNIAGLLKADGEAGNGGKIDIGGIDISLKDAVLDASGTEGGGRIRVGGAYQGGDFGAATTAEKTTVDGNSLLTASGIGSGDGGEVIVWANGTTLFDGTIEVKGGDSGGNGGLAETSGAERLWVGSNAFVNALAPFGAVGDWLLDPRTVTIADGGTATLTQIADAGDTTSDLTIDASALNGAAANVSIVATETITFNEAVAMTNAGVGLSATAGNLITVNTSISTTNGVITFLADNYAINADVNAGSATMMFDRVTAGLLDVGLTPGTSSGGAELDTAELALLTAGDLIFGNPVAAQNQVSALSLRQFPSNPNISGLVQFNALDGAGSFLLAEGNQTYPSVEFNANDGVTFTANATITTSVGDATFNVDADGTGTVGGFDNLEVNNGVTAVVNSAANILVKTPDIRERGTGTISLNANAGAGAITFARSSAGTIGVGGGNGRFMSFSDVQLTRLTAGTINFGDPTTPNKTSAINVNAADLSGIGTVNFNTAGTTSFSGANSFSALATSGGTTTVSTIATVNATGTLAFNTTTVNLDGNIGATGGITGTATTINVQGAAGGAEVQDGIAVAVNTGATVNVSDGTYAESVLLNKANVSLVGGAGAIIAPASPAFTISADGTTVDGFTFAGTSGSPAILLTAGADNVTITNGVITGTTGPGNGIQIDSTVTPGLTLDISNVAMTGVAQDGISFDGALTAADISISGSSIVGGRHGILFNGVITDANTEIDIANNSLIEGANQGIVFTRNVTDATVRIRGNGTDASNGIRGPFDAIAVNGGALTNATFIVGGNAAGDGNYISSTNQALDIDSISGGRFVVANNHLISGNTAIEFEQTITGAEIVVVDNSDISSNGRGMLFLDAISGGSSITIGGNGFANTAGDAIRFSNAAPVTDSTVIIGSATVTVETANDVTTGGNTMNGSANGNAIDVRSIVGGTTSFTIRDNLIGTSTTRIGQDGIHFVAALADTAMVSLGGNTVFATGQALEFSGIEAGAALSITGGTYDGTAGALLSDNSGVIGGVGTLAVSGSNFAGGSTFDGPVRLGGDTTIADSGDVTFNGTVDAAAAGGQSLTVNTAGTTAFNGAVGASAALFALNTTGGGETHLDAGSLTASGSSMTFGDAVVLLSDTTINDAGNVSFDSTVDGAFGLTVNTAAKTTFGGKVGGTTQLASLTTDAGGTTDVNGGLVATTGGQTYNDQVSVAGTVFAATGAGADLNFNAGVTTTLPDNDIWFLAVDDIVFGGSAQWAGSGDMSLVAGWDGVTGWVPGATTATTPAIIAGNAYGAADGDVIIGDGTQTTGIAVGSRNGTTTVLARDLVLSGSNTTDDSHAQLGFHGAATGDLAITLAGGLTATGGAVQRSHAQVGHGSNSSIFAHSGNLVVTAAGDVSLIGGAGNASHAQLGHGGVNGTGTAMGNISAIVGGLTTMTANTGGYWFGHATNGAISNANVALVSNGLSVTGGDFASMIRNDLTGGDVLIANRIAQIDDPALPAPAILTDDIVYSGIGLADEVMTDHSLTLAATGEINFDHGLQIDGTGNINLVSGWDGSTGLDLTGFPALDTAAIETAGAFGSSTGPFGDNGDVNIGDGQQAKSIYVGTRLGDIHVLAHDLEVRGSDDDFSRARLGANTGGNGSADSDIRIVVMDDVIVQGGDGVSSSAGIGHRLNDGSGALNGDITIIGDTAAHDNEVIVAGGDGEYAFAQIGHENAGGRTSGIISIAGEDVYVGTNHGSYAGGDGSTSQIGHYSDGFVGEASGDVTINASGQVVVTGGDQDGTFSVIGHEASIAEGDITLNVDGDMFVDGGIDDVTDAQVGHFAQISADGRISVNVGGDLFVRAGYSHDNAPAYIGHLGDGDLSGDIGIMVDGNLDLFGGFGDGSYGLIGHGDTEGYYFGARQGDIKVVVGGEATIMDGAGLNSEAWIGHNTGSSIPGAISDSNVLLQAFGFDRTNASTVTAGSLGTFNKNILLGNIPNGDFTLIATGTGLELQDPVYNSPFQLLVSVNNDLVLANGATFTNTGTGDIIFAAGGDFHNDTGSLTPLVTGGRWLVYSTRPDNNRNDIEITNWDFLRYSTPFDINNPIPASFAAGNGLIYSVTPVVSSVASDETTFYGQVPTPTITQTVTVNGLNVDAAQFVLFFDLSNPGFSYGGNVLLNGNGNPVIGYYQDGLVPNGLITSHYGVITNITEGDLTVVGTPVAPPATDTRDAVSQVVFAPCSPSEDDLQLTSNDRNTGQICTLLPTETD